MKKYIIAVDDELAAIYEDIALYNQILTEEAIQIILKRVIDTLLKKKS